MGSCNSAEESSSAAKNAPVTFRSKYSKGKQIGKGGYSVVFECTNKQSGEKFAVKEITRAGMKDDDEVALRQEVEILGSMSYSHIVKMVDFFEETEKYYMVLELLQGGELFDRIVQKTHYNEKEARDLINILFRAIKYIHDNNVAHRDLKPENLLLSSARDDADVKIADFGFAKRCDGLSLTTQCGSPGYIAPEILEKKKYGKPADMWSLGVITFILLGGYPPFHDDKDQNALFRKIRKGVFKFHPQYWDHISDDAKDLIRGMLTLDVHKRLTIDQALDHPWIRRPEDDLSQRNLASNLDTFKKFHATRKWRGAIKAVIALNRLRSMTDAGQDDEPDDEYDWVNKRPDAP